MRLRLESLRNTAPFLPKQYATEVGPSNAQRLEIIEGMIERIPAAERVAASGEKFVKALVNKMEADDELIVRGEPTLNGATGKRLMRKPRAVPIEDRIDDDFLILSVDSGFIRNGVRAKIRAINEDQAHN